VLLVQLERPVQLEKLVLLVQLERPVQLVIQE